MGRRHWLAGLTAALLLPYPVACGGGGKMCASPPVIPGEEAVIPAAWTPIGIALLEIITGRDIPLHYGWSR